MSAESAESLLRCLSGHVEHVRDLLPRRTVVAGDSNGQPQHFLRVGDKPPRIADEAGPPVGVVVQPVGTTRAVKLGQISREAGCVTVQPLLYGALTDIGGVVERALHRLRHAVKFALTLGELSRWS